MIPNPTEEIKAIRHRMGAELNFDLNRIVDDTMRRQTESGRTYIRLPKRDPQLAIAGSSDGYAAPSVQSSPPSQ